MPDSARYRGAGRFARRIDLPDLPRSYTDGQMLKGFTHDFHGSKTQFSLWPSTTAAGHERVVVPLARLKAVFFVREFNGNPDYIEQKMFEQPAHGRRIEVTLIDNEVLVGTTLNDRTGHLTPKLQTSNFRLQTANFQIFKCSPYIPRALDGGTIPFSRM